MADQRKPNQVREPILQEIFLNAFGSSGKSGTILLAQKWGSSRAGHFTTQRHNQAMTASFLTGWTQRAKQTKQMSCSGLVMMQLAQCEWVFPARAKDGLFEVAGFFPYRTEVLV